MSRVTVTSLTGSRGAVVESSDSSLRCIHTCIESECMYVYAFLPSHSRRKSAVLFGIQRPLRRGLYRQSQLIAVPTSQWTGAGKAAHLHCCAINQ